MDAMDRLTRRRGGEAAGRCGPRRSALRRIEPRAGGSERHVACVDDVEAMRTSRRVARVLAALALAPLDAAAATPTLPSFEVIGHYDNAVGTSDAASQGVIHAALLKSRPALRPGEVLEFVPGVIVTQHSGDGKANQYFLRGFNLDHGTDFATTVNGVPVNMPTHGHGQGYSDVNFLIPELVARVD